MAGRLFYIVGPSGSGKDSLLDFARARVPPDADVVFAKRTITRPAAAGGESHIAVTAQEFESLLASGAFAMHWRANGLGYGIGREIGDWLEDGRTVVVSGSRGHLPRAITAFPRLQIVSITASRDTLRARLAGRGRENAPDIEARLTRAASMRLAPDIEAHEICNDGDLAEAGGKLLELFRSA